MWMTAVVVLPTDSEPVDSWVGSRFSALWVLSVDFFEDDPPWSITPVGVGFTPSEAAAAVPEVETVVLVPRGWAP